MGSAGFTQMCVLEILKKYPLRKRRNYISKLDDCVLWVFLKLTSWSFQTILKYVYTVLNNLCMMKNFVGINGQIPLR